MFTGTHVFVFYILVAIVEATTPQNISYNGLANTPPMGWNNWNSFGCNVNAELLEDTANLMIKFGLRDIGYSYVILDDCWSSHRDTESQALVANAAKFPHGMAAISEFIHSKGMKFGMYSSAGIYTCAGYPGSLGYEYIDASTFADWGIDYLKYDNCYNNGQSGSPFISHRRYAIMSQALASTGRPIVYSLCNWGEDNAWTWAPTISNSWRISGDIYDHYNRFDARCPCSPEDLTCVLTGFHCSMWHILEKASYLTAKAQPGSWIDLDMLEVGNGGMTYNEYKTHFSMWAAMKSPLIIGTDLSNIEPEYLSIYLNAAVIAINQDPLGEAINLVWKEKEIGTETIQVSLWSGNLANGDQIVALINADNLERRVKVKLVDIFVDSPRRARQCSWDVHDLWGSSSLDASDAHNLMIDRTTAPSKYYNSSAKSYAKGLADHDPRLIGDKIATVSPGDELLVSIPAHGIGFYRLKPGVQEQVKSLPRRNKR